MSFGLKRHIKALGWGSKLVLASFLIVLIFADFIANEKPLYCEYKGQSFFPVFIDLGKKIGIMDWPDELQNINWMDPPFEYMVATVIPFSNHSIPFDFKSYQKPGSKVQKINHSYHHWLGTDKLGRDVAAGMIHGTRIAFFVGMLSVLLSLIIGLILGVLAGYFGDHSLSVSRLRLFWNLILIPIAWFYGIVIFDFGDGFNLWWVFFRTIFIIAGIFVLGNILYSQFTRIFSFRTKRIPLKMDFIISRGIEVFNSIPGLFLVLALLAVIRKPSIWNVILIIGVIRWPSIARLARSEMLNIREKEYIQSARTMGLSSWQIIKKHALPNGLNSVIVACAFGVAVAILLESSLSFLGIGLAPEDVSWGSLLGQARDNISAWWLSIFPGLAIFGVIILFNGIGNRLVSKA
jgi:peptide/nickel transport system permease protein